MILVRRRRKAVREFGLQAVRYHRLYVVCLYSRLYCRFITGDL